MKNKAIIVTGGCSFIGSHICRYLMDHYSEEYTIIAIDDLSGSDLSNIRDLIERGLIFHLVDLRNQREVKRSEAAILESHRRSYHLPVNQSLSLVLMEKQNGMDHIIKHSYRIRNTDRNCRIG